MEHVAMQNLRLIADDRRLRQHNSGVFDFPRRRHSGGGVM